MLERKEIDIGLADLSLTFPRIKVNFVTEKKIIFFFAFNLKF